MLHNSERSEPGRCGPQSEMKLTMLLASDFEGLERGEGKREWQRLECLGFFE